VRLVGITERTHNSPNTWRWQQHVDWIATLGRSRIKNVSMARGWWQHFAQHQDKVSEIVEDRYPPHRDQWQNHCDTCRDRYCRPGTAHQPFNEIRSERTFGA